MIWALSKLGLQVPPGYSFARLGVQAPLKASHYADLITPAKDGLAFDALNQRAVEAKLFNFPVKLVGKEDLVALKEHAATAEDSNSKHEEDVRRLIESAV